MHVFGLCADNQAFVLSRSAYVCPSTYFNHVAVSKTMCPKGMFYIDRERERQTDRQTDRQTARVTENHQTCRCKVLRKCYMGNLGLHVKSINNYKKKQKNQVVGF